MVIYLLKDILFRGWYEIFFVLRLLTLYIPFHLMKMQRISTGGTGILGKEHYF